MDFRHIEATGANAIAVFPKVIDVLHGKMPVPEVVEFFLTNFCSYKCPHCRCSAYHEDTNAYLPVESVKKLLDELDRMDVRTIEFGGGGEPAEHPDFFEILEMLRERNMRCGLITNGYALIDNAPLMDALVKVSDWVRISLDGVTESSYRFVHGKEDISYAKLRDALCMFARKASECHDIGLKTRLGIKLLIQECNKTDLAFACEEAKAIGCDFIQFKWLENHRFKVSQEARPEIYELLTRIKNENSDLVMDVLSGYGSESAQNELCILSVLHPLIDWDGSVYICAFFHERKQTHCFGNIKTEPFREIWYGEKHRDAVANVNPKQCVPNCPLKRYNPIIHFIKQECYRFRYI